MSIWRLPGRRLFMLTQTAAVERSRVLSYAPAVARILLGLVFFVFGLDGFLHFMPQPTEPPPQGAMELAIAMIKSGYLFELIKGTEVVVGILLLTNRFVPLALALIAPVIVNIVAFNAILAPSGMIWIPFAILALEIYLAWHYRARFRPMLAARA
jgi:uncharacterized membrane protein YphA (DoxX/SURF4 family)